MRGGRRGPIKKPAYQEPYYADDYEERYQPARRPAPPAHYQGEQRRRPLRNFQGDYAPPAQKREPLEKKQPQKRLRQRKPQPSKETGESKDLKKEEKVEKTERVKKEPRPNEVRIHKFRDAGFFAFQVRSKLKDHEVVVCSAIGDAAAKTLSRVSCYLTSSSGFCLLIKTEVRVLPRGNMPGLRIIYKKGENFDEVSDSLDDKFKTKILEKEEAKKAEDEKKADGEKKEGEAPPSAEVEKSDPPKEEE
jgi:hypothetical protein